jgi:hypothetical protein
VLWIPWDKEEGKVTYYITRRNLEQHST